MGRDPIYLYFITPTQSKPEQRPQVRIHSGTHKGQTLILPGNQLLCPNDKVRGVAKQINPRVGRHCTDTCPQLCPLDTLVRSRKSTAVNNPKTIVKPTDTSIRSPAQFPNPGKLFINLQMSIVRKNTNPMQTPHPTNFPSSNDLKLSCKHHH